MKQINEKTWQSDNGLITFIHGDCMEVMAGCKENEFELNVSDCPYGIGISGQKESKKGKKSDRKYFEEKKWDKKTPDKIVFDNIYRTSVNQILFGANYLIDKIQGNHKGWIIWDKMQYGLTMSDCEIAFSSFDTPTRIWKGNRCILKDQKTIHPTEKPIDLYRWIFANYAKPTDHIFDSHGGSMSSAIAAHMEGLRMTIIELDEEYFQKAIKRFATYESQQTISFDL